MYSRNGGHPRHLFGTIMGYASHSHINDCRLQSNVAFFSLYDLRCIIVATGRHIIALKRELLLPQLKDRRGARSPSPACLYMGP